MNCSVLGAGSWGIALANHCAGLGHRVTMWEFDPAMAGQLDRERQRESVLPGIRIAGSIRIISDLGRALSHAKLVLLVLPTHVIREVLRGIARAGLPSGAILVGCSKGLEQDTHNRVSEIVSAELPERPAGLFAVLSGPSHAEEVSRNIPTAIVAASEQEAVAVQIQKNLNSASFRVYRSHDITGVELGGALKNVIAIAAGICDGAGFGDNTKAALQPRGLAEIARLGRKLEADPNTFAGLSGMGDLIVTCMSRHSRNRHVGEQIGRGRKLDDILAEMTMVAEGVRTCRAAVALAAQHKVEMPICGQVHDVLFRDKEPVQAMQDLMTREVKPEVWY